MLNFSIIIPAYNEQDNIKDVVESIAANLGKDAPMIIIDDCSTDDTYKICCDLKKEYNVEMIKNEKNLGKTLSIIKAVKQSKTEILAFIDGDNQYFAEDLKALLDLAKKNDIVCGARSGRKDSVYRRFLSKGFNLFNRTMFGIKVSDVNCGMKAFKRDAFKNICIKYTKARWFIDTELLARAYDKGFKIAELSINHKDRLKGQSHVSGIKLAIETFIYGMKLKWELLLSRA
jgi:glycosyltransferase involved in cell wall biosynthesis